MPTNLSEMMNCVKHTVIMIPTQSTYVQLSQTPKETQHHFLLV